MITFYCPECGQRTQAADSHAGKSGACTNCRAKLRIPMESQKPPGDELPKPGEIDYRPAAPPPRAAQPPRNRDDDRQATGWDHFRAFLRVLGLLIYFLALLLIIIDYWQVQKHVKSAVQETGVAADATFRTVFLMAIAYGFTNFGRRR